MTGDKGAEIPATNEARAFKNNLVNAARGKTLDEAGVKSKFEEDSKQADGNNGQSTPEEVVDRNYGHTKDDFQGAETSEADSPKAEG